jgi:hypothetical protein
MSVRPAVAGVLGVVAGVALVFSVAACLPDEPAGDGIQHFEDGSWLAPDGTTGCDTGAPCDMLPPVPADAVPTSNGGYLPTLTLPPCVSEDSVNCYWDAARMGNGTGTSFVNIDGVYYYPEVNQ